MSKKPELCPAEDMYECLMLSNYVSHYITALWQWRDIMTKDTHSRKHLTGHLLIVSEVKSLAEAWQHQ